MPATRGHSTIALPRPERCATPASTSSPARGCLWRRRDRSASGLAYSLPGESALRATFDHTSVAPLPLEPQRTDSTAPAPPVILAPETADDYSFSYERGGRTQIRVTYYADLEKNRHRRLARSTSGPTRRTPMPLAFRRTRVCLRSHGVELFVKRGGLQFIANYGRTFTSSVDQFAYQRPQRRGNSGRTPLSGRIIFPISRRRSAYEFDFGARRLRMTPLLSYESGYPYGNGTMVWIVDSKTGSPELVPNDNYVNPGYNYYFLKNPAAAAQRGNQSIHRNAWHERRRRSEYVANDAANARIAPRRAGPLAARDGDP